MISPGEDSPSPWRRGPPSPRHRTTYAATRRRLASAISPAASASPSAPFTARTLRPRRLGSTAGSSAAGTSASSAAARSSAAAAGPLLGHHCMRTRSVEPLARRLVLLDADTLLMRGRRLRLRCGSAAASSAAAAPSLSEAATAAAESSAAESSLRRPSRLCGDEILLFQCPNRLCQNLTDFAQFGYGLTVERT